MMLKSYRSVNAMAGVQQKSDELQSATLTLHSTFCVPLSMNVRKMKIRFYYLH